MVHMTLEFVGKSFDYKNVNLMKGEQHDPEYLKVRDEVFLFLLTGTSAERKEMFGST